jgi:exodeoxyribonuclease VII large subunit
VLTNAERRWPAVEFRVLNVTVQGPTAVPSIIGALRALDADPEVDVIIMARGGGSVEDLLPFSDEALCRAVFACRTPVISAIGHEPDTPLVDWVADLRASTPTDAAKRVVPDLDEEMRLIGQARARVAQAARHRIDREQQRLDAIRSRPALADPYARIDALETDLRHGIERMRRCIDYRVTRADSELGHTLARLRALSPGATLNRGYAIVQAEDGRVLRDPKGTKDGDALRVRLAEGELKARVTA